MNCVSLSLSHWRSQNIQADQSLTSSILPLKLSVFTPVQASSQSEEGRETETGTRKRKRVSFEMERMRKTIYLPERVRLLSFGENFFEVCHRYAESVCPNCQEVPERPALCLLCGVFLCARSRCCTKNALGECFRHSLECLGGSGVFLLVKSSVILVMRGRKAAYWGSIYLDQFGEEDLFLTRGKIMHLDERLVNYLTQSLLDHKLDEELARPDLAELKKPFLCSDW